MIAGGKKIIPDRHALFEIPPFVETMSRRIMGRPADEQAQANLGCTTIMSCLVVWLFHFHPVIFFESLVHSTLILVLFCIG
jgi:hypothetical protein